MTGAERPSPTPEQEAAAASLDLDVMLEAGAGTGKTSTLVDRYVRAALQPEVGVRRILAFTFTDAAAGQLRGRVRSRLREIAEEALDSGDVEGRERALGLLRETSDAPISTIHGFCQRVLRTHPLAAGIDPRFGVLSESEAHRLTGAAFEHALAGLVEEHGPDAVELVAAFRHEALEAVVRSLHDELRSSNREPKLPPPPPAAEAEREIRARFEALGKAAETAVSAINASGSQTASVAHALECLGDVRSAVDAVMGGDMPDSVTLERCGRPTAKGNALNQETVNAYRDLYDEALAACRNLEGAHRYALIAQLLEAFAERYADLKADRSVLDFEDLQVLTVKLLERRSDIAGRYRSRFLHVMVDEFQDTNGLQARLIELVTGGEARVFRVGDRLQSIYGFRHADLDAFDASLRQAREREQEGNALVLRLSGNFRSSPRLLQRMNAIGDIVLPEQFEPPRHLVPGVDGADGDGEPVVDVIVTDEAGWNEDEEDRLLLLDPPRQDSPPAVTAEARAVAGQLHRLHAEEKVPLRAMVVLLRAFTHVGAYEEALGRAGLNPLVLGGKGFWSHQQVLDVRCMLAAIANPAADEPVLGLLASPAVGVSPDTLWLLRALTTDEPVEGERHARTDPVWAAVERWFGAGAPEPDERERGLLDAIGDEDGERLRTAHRTLSGLRERAHRYGLEELIDQAIAAFGYDLAILTLGTGTERMANVRKLMRIAREFEANEGRDLRGLLAELDAREEIDREGMAVVAATDHAGVRVMTIHTAKGLEFPVVAVPELGRRLLGGRTDDAVRVSPESDPKGLPARVGVRMSRLGEESQKLFDFEELTAEARVADLAEELRLFWVAITRAEDRLVLSGRIDAAHLDEDKREAEPEKHTILERLLRGLGVGAAAARGEEDPALDDSAIRLVPNAASDERAVTLAVRADVAEAGVDANRAGTIAVPPETTVSPDLGPASVSPSSLALYERCAYRFFVERVLGLGRSEVTLTAVDDGQDAAGEAASDDGYDEPATEADLGTAAAAEEELAVSSERRYGAGRAVHELLEESALAAWARPSPERIAEAVRSHMGEDDERAVARAHELVAAWLDSPLLAELVARGARFKPEVPFALNIAGVTIRGVIDLVCELDDEVLIVDFKTDRLGAGSPGEHAEERYVIQRAAYALAIARRGASTVRTSYVFLERPSEPVEQEFSPGQLADAEAMLKGLLEQMGSGRHTVTDSPHRALCWDCPARKRLCSYDEDVTLAPAAA